MGTDTSLADAVIADRLERDDHCQQPERIPLDAEADPQSEPQHMDVDEGHRSRERGDLVGDLFCTSWARSSECFSSTGLTG
jgi:hypothetical protein